MVTIKLGMFGGTCEHCPYRFYSITVPDANAAALADDSILPTHIEIECPDCGDTFYYTQDNWDAAFDSKVGHTAIATQPDPPEEDAYIAAEDVIEIQ